MLPYKSDARGSERGKPDPRGRLDDLAGAKEGLDESRKPESTPASETSTNEPSDGSPDKSKPGA